MKKKFLFISCVCFLIFPLSIGNTGEGLVIDGSDWERMSSSTKLYFVLGWMKSGKGATDNLTIYFDNLNESVKDANAQTEIFIREGILLGGVTPMQVIDTINIIYSDPRVKTMDITGIMPLVSGRLIQGWTLKVLDEIIAIKVKLYRCEKQEKEKGQFFEECGSLRKEMNSYLQKLKNK